MSSVLRSVGELVDELNDFQPTVLAGYPTALALMSAEQKAGRLTIKPLLAITAGQDLAAALRSDTESTFGCEIQNRYASAEFPALSIQCSEGRTTSAATGTSSGRSTSTTSRWQPASPRTPPEYPSIATRKHLRRIRIQAPTASTFSNARRIRSVSAVVQPSGGATATQPSS
jgi:hypothetical protein